MIDSWDMKLNNPLTIVFFEWSFVFIAQIHNRNDSHFVKDVNPSQPRKWKGTQIDVFVDLVDEISRTTDEEADDRERKRRIEEPSADDLGDRSREEFFLKEDPYDDKRGETQEEVERVGVR